MIYWLIFMLQLWTGVEDRTSIKAGVWNSCFSGDPPEWAESAYDHLNKDEEIVWTFHMGPRDDFALFKGVEPEGDDHDSDRNLLGKAHHALDIPVLNGKRIWTIRSLNLWISVARTPSRYDNCMTWYVLIKRLRPFIY